MQITKFLTRGLKGTLKVSNGTQLSYGGPWISVPKATVIDAWYVGDFMSADYTITVDQSTNEKEILKCIIVASPSNASIMVYGRTNLGTDLIELSATVDNARVFLTATPLTGTPKIIFSANYYQTLNPNRPA